VKVLQENERWEDVARHGAKFYAVGALGIGVQLATLSLFTGRLHFNYLLATLLAVELAVLHNFVWHERWTWKERTDHVSQNVIGRLLRFNLSTGALSIVGNVLFMRILVGIAHLHYFISSLLSIASCSLLNFFVSDRFVFKRKSLVGQE